MFRATYAERSNVVQALGEHCTNADCIMEPYSPQFTAHMSRSTPVLFCDECMESMREHIRAMIENENTLSVSNRSLPSSNQPSSDWKKPLREFYTKTATKEGLAYVENLKSQNYQAQLKRSNGEVTNIEASSLNSVSLSAIDKDGKPKVPEQKYFDDLVVYARQNKMTSIKLADIKTPEFKARMVLACLAAVPPMKMDNAPKLDETFFNGVEADTRQKIETAMLAQLPKNSQQKPAAIPTSSRQDNIANDPLGTSKNNKVTTNYTPVDFKKLPLQLRGNGRP